MTRQLKRKERKPPTTGDLNDAPEPENRYRIIWWFACVFPAFIVMAASFLFPANRVHEDEVYWIGSSYYYQLAVVQGDGSNPDWQLLPARENPVLGKYVIGLALQIAGHPVTTPDLLGAFYLIFADIPGAWGSDEAFEKRHAVATRVSPELWDPIRSGQALPLDDSQLITTRRTTLVFGMLAAIGLAVLGQQCKWKAGGLIAGVLFSLHPIVIESCSLAMIDMIAIAFSIWFMVGLTYIANLTAITTVGKSDKPAKGNPNPAGGKQRSADNAERAAMVEPINRFINPQWLMRASMTLFTAIMLAFACGSKMNSLVVAATAASCGIWYLLQLVRQRVQNSSSAINMSTSRDEIQNRTRNPVTACPQVMTSTKVTMLLIVAILAIAIFIGSNPTLYGDPIEGVMALSYEHVLTADIQEVMLGGRLNRISERLQALTMLVCGSPIAFTILGLAVTWSAYDCFRHRSVGIIIVLWWLIAMLLLIMWMPFAWERYTLPIIPPTMLILGAVIERAVCWLWSKISSTNRNLTRTTVV